MKRTRQTRQTLLTLAVLALLAAACGPKEGAPAKGGKLTQVTASETTLCDGAPYYTRDTYISEAWHWEEEELYRIDHIGEKTYSENFYYDNRHRILRTTVPAFKERNEFFYDGRQLEHIDCYRDSVLCQTITFTHDGNTLIQMTVTTLVADTQETGTQRLLGALMGDEMGAAISEECHRKAAQGAKAGSVHYHFSWEEGDISEVRWNDGGKEVTMTMTYDDKTNPRRQVYGPYEMADAPFGFEMMPKHNIVTLRRPWRHAESQLFNYSYEYINKYPSSRTLRYHYTEINGTTLQPSFFEVEEREEYTYNE